MVQNKRSLAAFLLFCMVASTLFAAPIWEIRGNGMRQPSYLFGASALEAKTVYDASPQLQRAFNNAETIILESNSSPSEFVMKLRTYGLMSNKRLRDLLSEEDYKQVDKEVRKAITVGLFFLPGSIKPAALSMIICSAWLKEEIGHKQEEYLNKWLTAQAKRTRKGLIGLESAEEQMDLIMNSGTMEYQAELLVAMLRQKEALVSSYKQSRTEYNNGNYEAVAQLGRDNPLPYSHHAEGLNQMINRRNHRWMVKIVERMKEKSCLVVVNPAQLVFDEGLISLLVAQGYTVTKL